MKVLLASIALSLVLSAHPRLSFPNSVSAPVNRPGCAWLYPHQANIVTVRMQLPTGRRWATAQLILKAYNQRWEIDIAGPRSQYQYYTFRSGRFVPGRTVYPWYALSIRNYGTRALFCWGNGWTR